LPSEYNIDKREISVETEFADNPPLATAALLQSLVHDLMVTSGATKELPGEFLDAAVVLLGFGGPRAQVELMSNSATYWDTTRWDATPADFLDNESLVFAHSLATWCRSGSGDDLPADLRAAKGTLKYLNKTNDSFFQQNLIDDEKLEIKNFLELAANGKESSRICAMQFFNPDHPHQEQQDAVLLENLQHRSEHVIGHAVSATAISQSSDPKVLETLKLLTDNHDDRLKAKAVQAVTHMGQLDEFVADNAAKMLGSSTNYVTYAGLLALSKMDSVSEDVLKLADRGFERALHTCNYQFIQLFAGTYKRWLDDPAAHLKKLWGERSPEYLHMATEALASDAAESKSA